MRLRRVGVSYGRDVGRKLLMLGPLPSLSLDLLNELRLKLSKVLLVLVPQPSCIEVELSSSIRRTSGVRPRGRANDPTAELIELYLD